MCQPDTRPGIYFNEDGVCGACLYEEEKKKINWNQREKELREIVEWAKEKAKKGKVNYDCAIGVSGGKDSTFQSLYARDILDLHPLLVNSEPEDITDVGRKNIENLKKLGFDVISLRPNPVVMKKLIKKDFYEYLNPVKVTEFSLWSSVYIIADKFNIPLIIQGENPGLTLGVRNTGVGVDDNALNANKLDTLSSGYERYIGDGITENDLFLFHYDFEAIRKKGIKGIWLQYYVKEWSQIGNAAFSISNGLWIKPYDLDLHYIGTYRRYSQLDSEGVQMNQMLKWIKFGFGQATDHACYDIREGIITRDEGIALVKEFDGLCAERYIKMFCDKINISIDEFWRIANSYRGEMWEKDNNGKWKLKNSIWEQENVDVDQVDIDEIINNLDDQLENEAKRTEKWFEKSKSEKTSEKILIS